MANWVLFTARKLSKHIQEQSGSVAILSLGLSLFLCWDAIARRYVLLRQDIAVEDAEDITYQTVSVSTSSGPKHCQILLDAGSLHNWISIEAAAEMDLPIQPVSKQEISSCSATDASGNEVVPLGKVALTWFWEGSNKPQTTIFYVGLRGAFLMILGSYYLFDKKIFTYNRKFVLPLKAKGKKEDKAGDEAAHAAQNTKSERDIAEKDAQRRREYEEYQRRNAGGPSQGNNAQGGSGSSRTTP